MQVFIRDRRAFLATRLLLGLAEAGYIPEAVYTFSTWYRKRELAKRVAVFFFGMFGATPSVLCWPLGSCNSMVSAVLEDGNGSS